MLQRRLEVCIEPCGHQYSLYYLSVVVSISVNKGRNAHFTSFQAVPFLVMENHHLNLLSSLLWNDGLILEMFQQTVLSMSCTVRQAWTMTGKIERGFLAAYDNTEGAEQVQARPERIAFPSVHRQKASLQSTWEIILGNLTFVCYWHGLM